jgi:hypothetical protein
MFKIDNLLTEFKDVSEWKEFAEAQNKSLVSLTKENEELKEKVKHLESLLNQTVPVLQPERRPIHINNLQVTAEDAEMICALELASLKKAAMAAPLTLDESRRFQIYTNALKDLRAAPKSIDIPAKKMSDTELLKLVEGKNE